MDSKGNPLPKFNPKHHYHDSRLSEAPNPALDSVPALSGYNPTYGQNASDLLSDQVNLSYQIFGLEMILQKSLSDRVLNNGEARLQAVLGFNVKITSSPHG